MDWRVRSHRRRAFNEPGHAHELTFTCYHRHAFLRAERCCHWLAQEIDNARATLDFALWAYVFMPEHVHLVVYPRRTTYDVREILKAVKEPVARQAIQHLREESPEWLPRLESRHGQRTRTHFWQPGGGYDRNIFEPNTLLSVIDYVHQNPVRRGLASHASKWKWSSAAWFETQNPNELAPDAIDIKLLPADLWRPRGSKP